MPKAVHEEESQWKLPSDTPLPAQLLKVEERAIPYKIKSGPNAGEDATFYKWEWEFEITDGEYAGLHAWGDTDPKLTTHPDNKVRQWGEQIRGKAFELGEGLDTDDLLGLPCVIVVDNTTWKKAGAPEHEPPKYLTPVIEVYNADALGGLVSGATTAPTWQSGGVKDPNDPWASSDEPPY